MLAVVQHQQQPRRAQDLGERFQQRTVHALPHPNGASDGVRTSIGAQRQPDQQILYDRWLARTLARLDTKREIDYFRHGGLLHYVVRHRLDV